MARELSPPASPGSGACASGLALARELSPPASPQRCSFRRRPDLCVLAPPSCSSSRLSRMRPARPADPHPADPHTTLKISRRRFSTRRWARASRKTHDAVQPRGCCRGPVGATAAAAAVGASPAACPDFPHTTVLLYLTLKEVFWYELPRTLRGLAVGVRRLYLPSGVMNQVSDTKNRVVKA